VFVSDQLLSRVLVPVATAADAAATVAALTAHAGDLDAVVAVTVVAGDGAPTEAERDEATDTLGRVVTGLAGTGVDVDTRVLGGSIVEAVVEAAAAAEATAVVFTPREDPGPLGRLTGDTTARLVRESSRPVVALPAPTGVDDGSA
jgi:nucleotide-binding universal stress UspA family protein